MKFNEAIRIAYPLMSFGTEKPGMLVEFTEDFIHGDCQISVQAFIRDNGRPFFCYVTGLASDGGLEIEDIKVSVGSIDITSELNDETMEYLADRATEEYDLQKDSWKEDIL